MDYLKVVVHYLGFLTFAQDSRARTRLLGNGLGKSLPAKVRSGKQEIDQQNWYYRVVLSKSSECKR